MLKDELEDPEMPDENDPEFKQELFLYFRQRGWKPEDLADKMEAANYAAWLETAPPEED